MLSRKETNMATKVSHKKSRIAKALLVLAILALIVVLLLFVLEKTKTTDLIKMPVPNSQSGPTEQQAEQQQKAEISAKEQFIDTTDATGKPLPPDATAPRTQPTTLVELTAKQEGSSVTILTKMQNISDGSCRLTLTNGAKSTSQTAQVIYQPEFASCAGFSVPVSTLGLGSWDISLMVTPSTGTEVTKSISVVVQ